MNWSNLRILAKSEESLWPQKAYTELNQILELRIEKKVPFVSMRGERGVWKRLVREKFLNEILNRMHKDAHKLVYRIDLIKETNQEKWNETKKEWIEMKNS